VAHLTAQRQKVRAEKERLRKLAELESVEDDIERRIEEARQKRG
jgi:ribosome-binding protein aMBF1 (putative translation factor)